MEAVRRQPIKRPPRSTFSPVALKTFRKMQKLETQCTCEPVDWKGEYWKHEQCRACDQRSKQHSVLHRELRCKPWQWYCVERPESKPGYPKGSKADKA